MLWYFPLESIASRYTDQLCNIWIPDTFRQAGFQWEVVPGTATKTDIETGVVLDATGRGIFSLTQVAEFLKLMDAGQVKNNDILYFQDYWTPGIEAISYAAWMMNIKLRIYSMLHAQSVDEYDFTYPMRGWMRHIELGYDRVHNGIMVASTVHKEQLRSAGWLSPIHVIGLPISITDVSSKMPKTRKENQVVYCSRLDWEKNPDFMIEVADRFLQIHSDWEWIVTTSRKKVSSNKTDISFKLDNLSNRQKRFRVLSGLSKLEYYKVLSQSKIQFNSSFQDYVSWTLLESCIAGCDIAYPDFRSFPECIPDNRRYKAFDIEKALHVLHRCINEPETHYSISKLCDAGRQMIPDILDGKIDYEVNIWQ